MPYDIVESGCPEGKPFAVVGPDGKVYGCHPSKRAARRQQAALYVHEDESKEHKLDSHEDHPIIDEDDEMGLPKCGVHAKTAIKRVRGIDYPPRDFAYVPNPADPASWKLLLTDAPGKISLEQLQRAAAAISPAGYRGNRLEIPPAAASSVKRRLLAEFRRLKVNDAEIPATIKEVKVDDSFMVWKDNGGSTRWFAVYSNNFRDDDIPPEILSEESHKSYVDLVDIGLIDYPELWLWHVPGTAWGKADWVAYADGFAMASGIVYPGYEQIAENLSKREDLLVSHGMPKPLVIYDPRYKRTTLFHVTTEISPLPDWAAANKMTGFAIVGKGDITMSLPKEKKEFLVEAGLGEDVIARIEANLTNARQAAIDAGVESKEIGDDDDEMAEEYAEDDADFDGDDADSDEDEVEEPVAAKAKTGRNEKVNWNSDMPRRRKKPKKDDENEKVNWNSDRPRRSNEKVNWNSDRPRRRKEKGEVDEPAYTTREEVAEAVSAVIAPIMQQIKQLGGLLETMSKEISDLRRDDEEKIANTKEVTPTLSLTEMIMRGNPIGKEAAKVKGSTSLGKDGPVQAEAHVPQATMVPMINEFISGMYQQPDDK